ncbi:MAG TPA: sterol desaturase family protein [Bacteroidia bacterium]|nr:sterol desaturase family protein [Bacteroidia bacterium]
MEKNFVSNKDESVVMFKSPMLDKMSRIHWSVPLYLFVPVVLFFLYRSIFMLHLGALTIGILFVCGVFAWTLMEYMLHRWFFHTELPGELGRRIHFIIHGVHHDYPNDTHRLVMVPSLSIPLAFIVYFIFWALLGNVLVAPLYAGIVAGYLVYDMTHYAIHHYGFKSKYWLDLKVNHMKHHYQQPNRGYGVSSILWDIIFQSKFKERK